jgi:hypothetical protein
VIRLQEALLRLQADLEALHLRWALIGGLAVAVHVEPRTTRDVDVVVAVAGDREAEQVVVALRGRGYHDYPLGAGMERRDMDRLAGYRFLAPGEDEEGLVVDVLFAFSGVEVEIVASAQRLEVFPGLFVPVIRPGHLLALKILASRPRDLEDARGLVRSLAAGELQQAKEILDLIEARGFQPDRSRDLQAELSRLLESGT